MIAKTYILQNLQQLDSASKKARPKHALYFSKLAILELCGWIEMSVDDIIESHARRRVKLPTNIKFVDKEIIDRTYGFKYDTNMRLMFVKLVGLCNVEKIEAQISPQILARFISELGSLTVMRNSLAHTYVKGKPGMINIDAPSLTISRFQHIYDGLSEIEAALKKLK